MTIPLSAPIFRDLAALADAHNVRLYVVGGYVRDVIRAARGEAVVRKDIDFTVVGDAVAFAQAVARQFRSKAVVYERFRTALVPVGEYQCEFVGTRKEEYLPNSRKPVVTEGTLEDDLRRRDFTVNALAACINPDDNTTLGEVIDLFGGLIDMERKLLRTPLAPDVTFSDDPLRMMRTARFAAQLSFAVEPAAIEAIRRMAHRIGIISQERVTDELLKILAVPQPHKPSTGFKFLHSTGLLRHVFPEVASLAGIELAHEQTASGAQVYRHKDVFFHTLHVVDNLAQMSDNLWLRFAALMHDIAKPKTKKFIQGVGWSFHGHEELGARWQARIFRRMKLPMQHLPYVETLVRLHQRPMVLVDEEVTDSAIRRLIVQADEALDDLFTLCRADITSKNPELVKQYLSNYDAVYQKTLDVRERDALRAFQSPVRGEEIMELCGIGPSRAVGVIKTAIEEAILDGLIPNAYDAAKAYFLTHKDEWLGEARKIEAERSASHAQQHKPHKIKTIEREAGEKHLR
jgi:tRNA nucleotidyltransferase/poly(A) polymerase